MKNCSLSAKTLRLRRKLSPKFQEEESSQRAETKMSEIEDEKPKMDPGRQEQLRQRVAFMLLVLEVWGRPWCLKSHRQKWK